MADAYWAKDILELFRLERRHSFQRLVELLMAQSGGLFEATAFARACEVSRTTVANYVAVLEATFVVHLVRPFAGGGAAEILSAPKAYGFDTGFVCYHRGWHELRRDDLGPLWSTSSSTSYTRASARGRSTTGAASTETRSTSCWPPAGSRSGDRVQVVSGRFRSGGAGRLSQPLPRGTELRGERRRRLRVDAPLRQAHGPPCVTSRPDRSSPAHCSWTSLTTAISEDHDRAAGGRSPSVPPQRRTTVSCAASMPRPAQPRWLTSRSTRPRSRWPRRDRRAQRGPAMELTGSRGGG